jgi:hypothetical protein
MKLQVSSVIDARARKYGFHWFDRPVFTLRRMRAIITSVQAAREFCDDARINRITEEYGPDEPVELVEDTSSAGWSDQ